MFFPDPLRGLKEQRRVLKVGGKSVVATWEKGPLADMNADLFKKLVPPPPNQEPTKPASIPLSTPESLEQIYREAGFDEVQVFRVTRSAICPTYKIFFEMAESNPGYTFFKMRLPQEKQHLFHPTLTEFITERYKEPLDISGDALIAVGTKTKN
jgi:hypothetical protein